MHSGGAVLSCTHGNRYIRLDMCQDHGVYSQGIPVMTCNDYKIDENIFSFGLCGNSEYEPVYSETAPPPAETGVDKDGNVRHICCPILLEKWGFGIGGKRFNNEDGLYIYRSPMPSECLTEMQHGDEQGEEYVEALLTKDNLICLYSGVITIEENPEPEEEMIVEEEPEVEEEEEAGFIVEDNWLKLYLSPTVSENARFVPKHPDAANWDWAMEEELHTGERESDWFEKSSPAQKYVTQKGASLMHIDFKMACTLMAKDDIGLRLVQMS